MEDKLQEKFALVQQMKREKEAKEAKAKESQPLDIFALAGVTLPASGSIGNVNHDTNMGTVKRPRKDRQLSTSNASKTVNGGSEMSSPITPSTSQSNSFSDNHNTLGSSAPLANDHAATTAAGAVPTGGEKKLKRSSMASRQHPHDVTAKGTTMSSPEHRPLESSVPSTGLSNNDSNGQMEGARSPTQSTTPASGTPPTPIPSPKTTVDAKKNSSSLSTMSTPTTAVPTSAPAEPTKPPVREINNVIRSRAGSMEEEEEMVIDMFGRSVPRSRHHSSDEGSDSENDTRYPRRRRHMQHEQDMDRYRPQYGRPRYPSRSRSRSRSPPPMRRRKRSRSHSRSRSRSRSISPYFRHGDDKRRRYSRDDYRGRHHDSRRGAPHHYDDRSGDEDGASIPGRRNMTEVDPYQAASRYLDTAFYPTKIYVGNLPPSISITGLKAAFLPFGEIDDMNLVEGKDFGFVTYVHPDGAQKALTQMNGAMLDGTYIRVNRAKIPERNRRGFAGVAWMDEDGELARMEEEQHQQAAAVAANGGGGFFPKSNGGTTGTNTAASSVITGSRSRNPSAISTESSESRDTRYSESPSHDRDRRGSSNGGGGGLFSSGPVHSIAPPAPVRVKPHSLPPKPKTTMALDPRAGGGVRGGRQILKYDDL